MVFERFAMKQWFNFSIRFAEIDLDKGLQRRSGDLNLTWWRPRSQWRLVIYERIIDIDI